MFDLHGKRAVVLGGTSGIGYAIALALAEAGADVVASSRRAEAVEKSARAIEKLGGKTLRMSSDVADRKSLERLRERIEQELGPVSILFNCAGMTQRISTLEVSEQLWGQIIDINLTGTLRACQVFGRGMVERGYGRIIQHRLAGHLCRLYGGRSLWSEQGRGRCADEVAGCRVGGSRRHRERHRARHLPYRAEQRHHRFAAWAGAADAHPNAALRQGRGAHRDSDIPRLGRGKFCNR